MAFTVLQKNWRWYANDAAEPVTPLAGENSPPVVPGSQGIIRLRLTLAETGGSAGSGQVNLQWSTDDVNFYDLGTSLVPTTWNYANGAGASGGTIAGRLLSDSDTNGKYHENSSTSESWAENNALEVDFAITAFGFIEPGAYYFRARRLNTVLAPDAGETHPALTVTVQQGVNVSKSTAYAVLLPPRPGLAVSKGTAYAVLNSFQAGINVSKALAYAVLEEAEELPEQDDGMSSGGLVFGGAVVEVGENILLHVDPTAFGGVVFGGLETSTEQNNQVDGIGAGGLVFGGETPEQWLNPLAVAVTGGTYRIGGVIHTLANTMYYEGLGNIAALVMLGPPPETPGHYRYDLLSIDATGEITLTEGTEYVTPVMPAVPAGQLKLNHILRFYGQEQVVQADIGKIFQGPVLTVITATAEDPELSWNDLSTTITVEFFDQYGAPFIGNKVVNASFLQGNGSISPISKSGTAAAFTLTYTRNQRKNDVSPIILFKTTSGVSTTVQITILTPSQLLLEADPNPIVYSTDPDERKSEVTVSVLDQYSNPILSSAGWSITLTITDGTGSIEGSGTQNTGSGSNSASWIFDLAPVGDPYTYTTTLRAIAVVDGGSLVGTITIRQYILVPAPPPP